MNEAWYFLIGLLLWLATMLIMPLLIEQLEVVAGWLG